MTHLQKGSAALPPRNSRVASTFRALRYRNFQLFFSGQVVSLIGTWMQSVAQAWLVYRLTVNFLGARYGGRILERI